jgi:hypothetical protein
MANIGVDIGVAGVAGIVPKSRGMGRRIFDSTDVTSEVAREGGRAPSAASVSAPFAVVVVVD